jgi:hypothetical protein
MFRFVDRQWEDTRVWTESRCSRRNRHHHCHPRRRRRFNTYVQSAQRVQCLQGVGAHVVQWGVAMNARDTPDVRVSLLLCCGTQDDGHRIIRPDVCVDNKIQGPPGLDCSHLVVANSSCNCIVLFFVAGLQLSNTKTSPCLINISSP